MKKIKCIVTVTLLFLVCVSASGCMGNPQDEYLGVYVSEDGKYTLVLKEDGKCSWKSGSHEVLDCEWDLQGENLNLQIPGETPASCNVNKVVKGTLYFETYDILLKKVTSLDELGVKGKSMLEEESIEDASGQERFVGEYEVIERKDGRLETFDTLLALDLKEDGNCILKVTALDSYKGNKHSEEALGTWEVDGDYLIVKVNFVPDDPDDGKIIWRGDTRKCTGDYLLFYAEKHSGLSNDNLDVVEFYRKGSDVWKDNKGESQLMQENIEKSNEENDLRILNEVLSILVDAVESTQEEWGEEWDYDWDGAIIIPTGDSDMSKATGTNDFAKAVLKNMKFHYMPGLFSANVIDGDIVCVYYDEKMYVMGCKKGAREAQEFQYTVTGFTTADENELGYSDEGKGIVVVEER